jgi:hypothetical protein
MHDTRQLKEEFQRAEANYIAALNRMNGFTGSPSELWQLRTAMEAAQRACEEAGVAIGTVEEWAKQERAKNEQWLRASAERISSRNVEMMRQVRTAISIVSATGLTIWLSSTCNMGIGVLAGAMGGLLIYAAMCHYFPTAWMRLGRQAARRGVHLHLWNDARQKEFDLGWKTGMRRSKEEWIRVYK